MPIILAAVGDTHVNSTTGLLLPSADLDDGGVYCASKGQRWLWRSWLDYWAKIEECSRKNKAKIWTVMNGDILDADPKNHSTQVITKNQSTILRMTVETLKPALDISERVFVVRGTAAHSGKAAELEEALAYDIRAEKCPEVKTYSWWDLLLECDGVLFDIEHHSSLGRLPWTHGNALNSLAVRLILKYAGKRLPQVAIRAHNHHYSTSSDEYPIKVHSNYAWQLNTEYSHRRGNTEMADIGGMYFVCDKGNYEVHKRQYRPEPRKVWRSSPKMT